MESPEYLLSSCLPSSVISTNSRSEVTNNPDGALAEWKKQVADGSFASSSSELFTVSGNQLKTNDTFDFETNSSFTINIEVTDKDDLTYTKALTIGINDKNDAPRPFSPSSVAEGQPRDCVVGTFSAEDTDVEDSHSYRLVGGADKALFSIKGDKLYQGCTGPRKESQYEVIVEAKETALAHSETLIVSVEDVNEPPEGIALGNDSISENLPLGSLVSSVSVIDPDGDQRRSKDLTVV